MMKQLAILFLCVVPAGLYAQLPGLVAKYSFNKGNARDEAGTNHAKTVGVTLTEDRFGNPNSAYFLHGNDNSYLNLGTSKVLKPIAGTISIWIRMENPVYSGKGVEMDPVILTKCQPGDDFYEAYCIAFAPANRKLGVTTTLSEADQVCYFSSTKVPQREWMHIVMSYDDKYLCLYINGEFENCMAKNFRSRFLEGDSVMVGHTANKKNHRFYNGAVDDIEIYNRVLAPQEVSILYNSPNPNKTWELIKKLIIIFLSLLAVFLLVLLATFRYKKELQKEKEKNKLQSQMYEMEMKVIKAQMNPHFIFNSLNSIQKFILVNDNEQASLYLLTFSKLLRKILESNTEEFISLQNETDILTKYMQLEALRFKQEFNYEIVMDVDVIASAIKIPQMLIQPVVENAIWHGLLPQKNNRLLQIKFEFLNEKALLCTVEDNGVGRNGTSSHEKEEKDKVKNKSLAIHFIRQRLQLMKKQWGYNYGILIRDKSDAKGNSTGTKVEITMPILYD